MRCADDGLARIARIHAGFHGVCINPGSVGAGEEFRPPHIGAGATIAVRSTIFGPQCRWESTMPNALGQEIIDRARAEGFELYCLPGEYQLRNRTLSTELNALARKMPPRLLADVNNHRDDILEALGCPKPRTMDD